MKTHTLVLTALAAASAFAVAASPVPNLHPLRLGEMVTHIESTYHGKVMAIAFDASGDKRPHYHVDIRLPQSGVTRLDVDAASRAISAHDVGAVPPGAGSL